MSTQLLIKPIPATAINTAATPSSFVKIAFPKVPEISCENTFDQGNDNGDNGDHDRTTIDG
jgi:hypothetical protein